MWFVTNRYTVSGIEPTPQIFMLQIISVILDISLLSTVQKSSAETWLEQVAHFVFR